MSTPTAVRSKAGYFTGCAGAGAGFPKSGCGWACGRAALLAAGWPAEVNGGKRAASGLGCVGWACWVCCGCGGAAAGCAGRAA